LRYQLAHANLLDDVPDAVDVVLLAHVNAYELYEVSQSRLPRSSH
jgi:hypothetical protein